MSYSVIAGLGIIILLTINRDAMFNTNDDSISPSRGSYRLFLFCVMAFYISDLLWGVFAETGHIDHVYLDTVLFFSVMSLCVLLWTRYVIVYLNEKSIFGMLLKCIGWILFGFQMSMVLVNLFYPIMFYFDDDGNYHALWGRFLVFAIQILMYIIVSFHMFYVASKTHGSARSRFITIGAFGIAMIAAIAIQEFYPLLPVYSMGFMLGTCLIHSFVHEAEKTEYRKKLEEHIKTEERHKQQLGAARRLAYTDALTGVKSKHAYDEAELRMDMRIAQKDVTEFAVGLFDMNDLKIINDTMGHETGDTYIINACRTICRFFGHSPVFRVGGDEFVVLIEGEDYENRYAILEEFNQAIEENSREGKVVVSGGIADYDPEHDKCVNDIFRRADDIMYERKRALKDNK